MCYLKIYIDFYEVIIKNIFILINERYIYEDVYN